MIRRFIAWFRNQSREVQVMIIMIPVLLLAILLNLGRVWEGVSKGFSYFRK
ncbi:MAG TPA: hypothetical protein PLM86_06385 [Bacteroidales bacterium]|nr:MAG: hypothetical protein BWX93_00768 [Bacteroidetes bacterium ADurb.Bin139]HOG25797.1 hypothetical protein [Bacteroidales bacterium]HOR11439.1 hypothetical protein [Bacteroidales bacterium]HOZ19365.1 hypothetical protein [Bacteroidales bacterium]HPB77624.1 hypothetical protein [Bacteroidales bacterium]